MTQERARWMKLAGELFQEKDRLGFFRFRTLGAARREARRRLANQDDSK